MANRSNNNSKKTCFTVSVCSATSNIQIQNFEPARHKLSLWSASAFGRIPWVQIYTGPATRSFVTGLYTVHGLWIEGYYGNRKLYFIIAPPCLCPLSEIGSPEYIPCLFISLLSGREGDFDRLTVSAHAITTLHLYLRRVH
ncbi:hypothetical protein AMECASPLE_003472 [Ameca splendens]|uniref:Uncharacterized protein n=1 Tax=Ameca splendens TaxID=208324 RepID=A0ABV0YWM6_9TELE